MKHDPAPSETTRAPWQIAEGRQGRPQAYRVGQHVRFRPHAAPDWASDRRGMVLEIVGAFAAAAGGVQYRVRPVGADDGAMTDINEEWLEEAQRADG